MFSRYVTSFFPVVSITLPVMGGSWWEQGDSNPHATKDTGS